MLAEVNLVLRRRVSGAGLRSAVLMVVGTLNIVLALGLLIFSDVAVRPIQVIAGFVMLGAGLLAHVQGRAPAVTRAKRSRRVTRSPLVRALLAFGVGVVLIGMGWARAELREESAPNEFEAPAIDMSYPYIGEGVGGMRVGFFRGPDSVSWRVNSSGTDNCRPTGTSALWNFAEGTARVDRRGRFHASGTFFSPDRDPDGTEYEKQVDFRLRGRFMPTGQARGTYWRRDRYDQLSELQFTCIRAGGWSARIR